MESIADAIAVRVEAEKASVEATIVLLYLHPRHPEVVCTLARRYRITIAVYSVAWLEEMTNLYCPEESPGADSEGFQNLKIHLFLDLGTLREGIGTRDEALEAAKIIRNQLVNGAETSKFSLQWTGLGAVWCCEMDAEAMKTHLTLFAQIREEMAQIVFNKFPPGLKFPPGFLTHTTQSMSMMYVDGYFFAQNLKFCKCCLQFSICCKKSAIKNQQQKITL